MTYLRATLCLTLSILLVVVGVIVGVTAHQTVGQSTREEYNLWKAKYNKPLTALREDVLFANWVASKQVVDSHPVDSRYVIVNIQTYFVKCQFKPYYYLIT